MADEMLMQHLNEELHDVEAYMEVYHETECGVFKDLAHEEMSHARILKEMCDMNNVDPELYLSAWEHAERILMK